MPPFVFVLRIAPGNVPVGDHLSPDLEARLNAAKQRLDGVDYEKVARVADSYRDLRRRLRDMGIPHVSNAWLKMYELMKLFPLVRRDASSVTHFDNAALPGAFIEAVNNYMALCRPNAVYDWRASSMVPQGAGDNDYLEDIYGLWRRNPERWLMRRDDPARSGDVTDPAFVDFLRGHFNHGVDLYTSDAGISVAGRYNDQERLNMKINLGQILCGLEVLTKGGSLVTKQYTFFHPFTYTLMVLTAACFEKFCVAKPASSRPGNSEVYLVGLGYKGHEAAAGIIAHLRRMLPEEPRALLDVVPSSFMEDVRRAAVEIYGRQIATLDRNVALVNTVLQHKHMFDQLHAEEDAAWIKKYLPGPIPDSCQLRSDPSPS